MTIELEEIDDVLSECQSALEASNCPFSDWERDFIESVTDQFDRKGSLSEKQRETLKKIWEKI